MTSAATEKKRLTLPAVTSRQPLNSVRIDATPCIPFQRSKRTRFTHNQSKSGMQRCTVNICKQIAAQKPSYTLIKSRIDSMSSHSSHSITNIIANIGSTSNTILASIMPPRNDDIVLLKHQLTSALSFSSSSGDESPAASTTAAGSRGARFDQQLILGNNNNTNNTNDDDEDDDDQQLFFVTSYSDFDKLAHGPRGHGAKHTLRVYKFVHDGSLVLWHIAGDATTVINPAFSRFHPR